MRIISGTARGMKLRSLPIDRLRPMLDRVKESLFNILRDIVPDARVLDLFSGSGALGLEALSRGAAHCTFVESDRRLAELIEGNADHCRLRERCAVIHANAYDLLRLAPNEAEGPADLALIDPPYAFVDDPNERARLMGLLDHLVGPWLEPGAQVVLHHRPIPYAVWPVATLTEWDKRIYGQSQLTFFEVTPEAEHG